MPLYQLNGKEDHFNWALWRIEESEHDLWRQLLPNSESQHEFLAINHPQKRLEWLASRLVIQSLVNNMGLDYQGIYKDAFGKPHLSQIQYSISIAHCFPLAVGAIHKHSPIGIDIEKPRMQLLNIRDRFLNQKEAVYAGDNLEKLCKLWTGKEALYKLYGRKKLIFREHIEVSQSLDHPDQLYGRIRYGDYHQEFELKCFGYQGYYVTYNL